MVGPGLLTLDGVHGAPRLERPLIVCDGAVPRHVPGPRQRPRLEETAGASPVGMMRRGFTAHSCERERALAWEESEVGAALAAVQPESVIVGHVITLPGMA